MPVDTSVKADFDAFNEMLPNLVLLHDGEWVVIKDTRPVNFSPSYEAALTWGYEHFGFDRFFVKKVSQEEAISHFSRGL